MAYHPLKNPADAFLVHIQEEWEVIYWCKKFDCNKAELQQAIDAIGNSPVDIKSYFLRRQRNVKF
jgi:uncharacterized protein DUF3606